MLHALDRVNCSHGQTFDLLHFGHTFSKLLGRQIKGRGRGHQPFPNKMKYRWPKVSVRPPLERAVCWVSYPFSRIECKFYIKYWFDSRRLKKGSVLGRLPFFKCRWPSLVLNYKTMTQMSWSLAIHIGN